jgi:hypothetical protein
MYTTFLLFFFEIFKVYSRQVPSSLVAGLCLFAKEKWKMCPKLIELLSWNGPTVHARCFILARASTKTFVSRVQKTAKKSSLTEKFVSRVTRSLAEVSLYKHVLWLSTHIFQTRSMTFLVALGAYLLQMHASVRYQTAAAETLLSCTLPQRSPRQEG